MARDIDDDAYVAELLKQDAKKATKTYELVGIDAFNPRRMNSRAPRPNKNFLQHLIRQTDSHNTALLAKEAEESRARLRKMDRDRKRAGGREEDNGRGPEGRLTTAASDNNGHDATPRRRRDRMKRKTVPVGNGYDRGLPETNRAKTSTMKSKSVGDLEGETTPSANIEGTGRILEHLRHHGHGIPKDIGDVQKHATTNSHEDDRRSNKRSASPASDSDPLEAIVGPIPPPCEPTVRSKGRGAYKANNMGIESRFSSTYNPSTDVCVTSDVEDDWGDALEALRDRARWQQQGADRLKAAGFTDAQVKKWERGDTQNEEDVVWTSKGQAREWDRGKVLDEDGDVELKADFGRLK
ncbi:unnamed protein product [Alternaria alternata]